MLATSEIYKNELVAQEGSAHLAPVAMQLAL